MKALYISNYRAGKKDFSNPIRNLKRFLFGHEISGQDGFFAGALHLAFSLDEKNLEWLVEHRAFIDARYDALFINYKCDPKNEGVSVNELRPVLSLTLPKILVVTNARADILPENNIIDLFDLIFKREHLRDIDRYQISDRNKAKIRNTMLPCPLIPATTRNLSTINPAGLGFKTPPDKFNYDLFFSGKRTSEIRVEVFERLKSTDFFVFGGLQAGKKEGEAVSARNATSRLNRKEYIRAIRSCRVNLALEGYGQYTFRHHEILFLCGFLLSSPSIREIALPIDLEEGKHFVCFDGLGDLEDKIRHYTENDQEREGIARAGRNCFEKGYCMKTHATYIRECLCP